MSLVVPVGPHDHVLGDASASVTLVEYGDYQCPYCGQAYPIVKKVQHALGTKLRFVFRNFPLAEAHPHALGAAEAAEAAGAQGHFWEMHDRLYEHQSALDARGLVGHAKHLGLDVARFEADLAGRTFESRIRDDFAGGARSGVNGTPSFFINGTRFDGDWTDVESLRDAVLASAPR